jgi:hypothetical protein
LSDAERRLENDCTSPKLKKCSRNDDEIGAEKRIALAEKCLMAARKLLLASLPKIYREHELKKRYYFQMYGEPLPGGFFSKIKNKQ